MNMLIRSYSLGGVNPMLTSARVFSARLYFVTKLVIVSLGCIWSCWRYVSALLWSLIEAGA